MTITSRVAVGATLLTLFVLLVLGSVSYFFTRQLTLDYLQTEMSKGSREIVHNAETNLEMLHNTLLSLSQNALVGNAVVDSVGREVYLRSFLEDFIEINQIPITLVVTDFRGVSFAQNRRAELAVNRSWITQVVDDGEERIDLVRRRGSYYLVLGVPIIFSNTGQPEGALLLQVGLFDLFASLARPETLAKHNFEPALCVYFRRPESGERAELKFGIDTGEMIAMRNPLHAGTIFDRLELQLEVFSDPSTASAEVNKLVIIYLLVGIAALALTLSMSRVMARSVTHRLYELETATRDISLDNIGGHRLPEEGEDEVAQLSSTFNHMLDRVQSSAEELKRSEERLQHSMAGMREAREAAEFASRAKSDFLANISHELRTPLNAILGFSHLLEQKCRTCPSQKDNLGVVMRSSEHLLSLINSVLDMSSIESGKMQIEFVSCDLDGLVRDVVELSGLKAAEKGISLGYELLPGTLHYIRTDAAKLRQILINLLSNAIKYTEEGGVALRVRTEHTEHDLHELSIEVQDSGCGMEKDALTRIFDKFVKVGKMGGEGTGLGLSITKSFVDLLNGRIRVTSDPGVGSLFQVMIPVREATKADNQPATESSRVLGVQPGQPAYRILVVEDNRENRLLLTVILENAGLDVRTATNGEEAIALFEEWRPHLIWMDMRMPVMDGYKATRRIKAMPGGDKCIIVSVTASVFEDGRKRILDAGCDAILRKPYRDVDVFALLENLLGLRLVREDLPLEASSVKVRKLLLPEDLDLLPKEWKRRFATLTRLGNIGEMKRLLDEVESEHPQIAFGLSGLIDRFQFERILILLGE